MTPDLARDLIIPHLCAVGVQAHPVRVGAPDRRVLGNRAGQGSVSRLASEIAHLAGPPIGGSLSVILRPAGAPVKTPAGFGRCAVCV